VRKTIIIIISIMIFLFISSNSMSMQKNQVYKHAVHLYMKGKFKQVEKILKEYVDKNPDPAAYYLLGYAFYKQNKFKEAKECFENAYLIEPNFTMHYINFPKKK